MRFGRFVVGNLHVAAPSKAGLFTVTYDSFGTIEVFLVNNQGAAELSSKSAAPHSTLPEFNHDVQLTHLQTRSLCHRPCGALEWTF